MNYRQFQFLTDAQFYCNAQTVLMNLPVGGVTIQWATPIPLADGSYVVPAYQDDTAISWQSNWQLPTPPNEDT